MTGEVGLRRVRIARAAWRALCPITVRRLELGVTLCGLRGRSFRRLWDIENGVTRTTKWTTIQRLAAELDLEPDDLAAELLAWRNDEPTAETAHRFLERLSCQPTDT